jgi:hypothetical protein
MNSFSTATKAFCGEFKNSLSGCSPRHTQNRAKCFLPLNIGLGGNLFFIFMP